MRTQQIWVDDSLVISGEFGIFDKKWRKIGYELHLHEVDLVEIKGENYTGGFWSNKLPGHYFVFYPQATRDGEKYGACQQDRFFKTKEERDSAVQKYIESAKKRNQSKFK